MSHRINLKELTPVCVPEQSMKNVAGQMATSFGYRTFLEKRESTIFDSEYCKSNKKNVLCGQYGKTISDAFSFVRMKFKFMYLLWYLKAVNRNNI